MSKSMRVKSSALQQVTRIRRLPIESIKVIGERRRVDKNKVRLIAESMKKIGLGTPLSVRKRDNGAIVLVTGQHRLEAAKLLDWKEIDCMIMKGGKIQRELWTIAENLYRSDLTRLQEAEHIARWTLLIKKLGDGQVAQPGGRQPQDKGMSRTAKELGVTRETVRRSKTIAGASSEAKAAARKAGLDRNQDALLKIAQEATVEAQVAKVRELAKKKEVKRAQLSADEMAHLKTLRRLFKRARKFKSAWIEASLAVRRSLISMMMKLVASEGHAS
jgi:ParB-like chromosome segregation protein Spo0J